MFQSENDFQFIEKTLNEVIADAIATTEATKAKRVDIYIQRQNDSPSAKFQVVTTHTFLVNTETGLRTGVFKNHGTPKGSTTGLATICSKVNAAIRKVFTDLIGHREVQFVFQGGALMRGIKESKSWRFDDLP